jgi:O-succinylbenzoate synthase
MQKLCAKTAIPIALDEELIGIFDTKEKRSLLTFIKPQFIILKPGLLGGFSSCSEWIDAATSEGIGYWITSALESNVGLNAIAQWTSTLGSTMHQGLGTGSLYNNNIPSPLLVRDEKLWYDTSKEWDFSQLNL